MEKGCANSMKVCSVVGNRPQFIKSVLLHHELRQQCELVVVNTGQHYDYALSGIFFDELEMPGPDYDLHVGSGGHVTQVARVLDRIEEVIKKEKPDKVIVWGDTNSTLGAALAAVKMGIPVAHVEAGPRQYDLGIPEEVNRVVVDHISTYLFAPTQHCANVLLMENIPLSRVWTTGDVMFDNFLRFAPKTREHRHVLVTIHRPVNTDNADRLWSIIMALESIQVNAGIGQVIFPAHPRTVHRLDGHRKSIVSMTEPVSYLEMLSLLCKANLVITDSGGLQKEAYWAGVPCLNVDVSGLWPELEEAGWNRVVDPVGLIDAAIDTHVGQSIDGVFGDGKAYKRIAEILTSA